MSTAIPPVELPRNFVTQMLRGASYPFSAIGFLSRHQLWRLAAVPIVINLLLLGAMATLLVALLVPYLQQMDLALAAMASDSEALRWVFLALGWLVWIIALPLVVVLSSLVVLLVGQVVASPFLDMLSERVECIVLGQEPAPFSVRRLFDSVFVALGDLVWGLLYLMVMHVPVLLLSFVPVVGAVVSVVCGALLMSQEFVGLPLARHLVSYRARWHHITQNRWLSIGFGSAAMVVLMVPGLNLLLLPLAAVGGTLLYCDLKRAGRI